MCEYEAVIEQEFANFFEDDNENIQLAREEEQDDNLEGIPLEANVDDEDNMSE